MVQREQEFLSLAQSEIDRRIKQLADEGIAVVSEEARSFIVAAVREALRLRMEEARRLKYPVDDAPKLAMEIGKAVGDLLRGAASLRSYETRSPRPVISLISVIEAIHLNWCKVWPFCR